MSDSDITLPEHEVHSERRAERVIEAVHQQAKGEDAMEHGVSDKVEVKNIFEPGRSGGEGGMGGLGTAAVIAAMGNRNEGMSAIVPAMMAGRSHHDGFGMGGFGAGLVGGVLGGLLFGRRGIGGFDGDGGCNNNSGLSPAAAAFDQTILNGVVGLTASVPTTALQTQAAIQSAIASLALAEQQGFANVKDSVQANSALNLSATNGVKDSVQTLAFALSQAICGVNQNVSAQGCETREAVQNDGDKTRALLQTRFSMEDQTRIQTLANEVIELRNEGRRSKDHDELRLQITNTNTAVAAQQQGQQQQQFQTLATSVSALFPLIQGVLQVAHATNSNVIAGNTGAVTTGAQTANPTNVNA